MAAPTRAAGGADIKREDHIMILLALLSVALVIGVPIAIIIFGQKVLRLEQKLSRVEDELAHVYSIIESSEKKGTDAVADKPAPAAVMASVATAPPMQAIERAPITPPVPPPVPPAPRSQPRTAVAAAPSRSRQEWEALVGGKLLNRIGALALIIGVGFFLKYAFDNDWISETMRVLIGAAAGLGLLVLGAWTTKKNLAVFAQGIIGAGIAILYLSVYASFNFYHLVPQVGAFLLMSAVTAIALWHGLRYNSLAVALLGWVGGFLTPFLLNTGEPNSFGLLSYIAILDVGLLAIVMYRPDWEILSALSLGATYVVYFIWFANYGTSLSDSSEVAFLSIFWGLFYLAEIWLLIRQNRTFGMLPVVSAANVALFVIATWLVLERIVDESARAVVIVLLAAIYGASFVLLRRRTVSLPAIRDQYAVTSIVLLALASYFVLDSYALVTVWSLEALVLIALGTRFSVRSVWITCLFFFALIAVYLVNQPDAFHYESLQDFALLLNQRALAFAVLTAVLAASSLLFSRYQRNPAADTIRAALVIGWVSVLFALLSVETLDYFRKQMYLAGTGVDQTTLPLARMLALVMLWSLYALPLVWLGIRRSSQTYLALGMSCLGVALVTALMLCFNYRPIDHFVMFLNLRFVAFVVLIGALVIASRLEKAWAGTGVSLRPLLSATHLAIVLSLLYLITAETWNAFDRLRYAASTSDVSVAGAARLVDLQQLSLSGVWLVFSVALMAAGLWRRAQMLRLVAIVLFGITILKIFIYDLSFLESLYRIVSFIGLGVILLAVSYLYQRYKGIIFEGRAQTT